MKTIFKTIITIFIIVITVMILTSCTSKSRQALAVNTVEPAFGTNIIEPVFQEIDSTYSIGAFELNYTVDNQKRKDIKYILYKDAIATDIFCFHNTVIEMQYTNKDLQEYLLYLYEESNPIAFKLK